MQETCTSNGKITKAFFSIKSFYNDKPLSNKKAKFANILCTPCSKGSIGRFSLNLQCP